MQSFNLNLVPGSFQQVFNCSQGDVDRQLTIRLFDGSAEYTVPVGATVKIKATKPSGFGFDESATFSGSTVTITTTETMTNEWGRFPAELEITNEGLVIGTANFLFNVEKNPHPASTVDGDAEEVIPELTLLVERVEAAASSVLDMEVVAETLPAGSQATYSYDEDLNKATFGIPQGEAGAGAAGVVASAYSSSKTYKVGDYAIHNSNLYRCITAITTAEAFTAAHWTQVVLADDVSDLKTDLRETETEITGKMTKVESNNLLKSDTDFEGTGYVAQNGQHGSNSAYYYTHKIPVAEGDVIRFYWLYSTWGLKNTRFICAYNSSGQAVSALGAENVSSYTVPEGITSIVATVDKSSTVSQYMITKNYEASAFEAYYTPYYTADEGFIIGVLDEFGLPPVPVKGSNLINAYPVEVGFYDKNSSGKVTHYNYDSYRCTVIPIKQNTWYYLSVGARTLLLTDDSNTVLTYFGSGFSPDGRRVVYSGNATKMYYTEVTSAFNSGGAIVAEGFNGYGDVLKKPSFLVGLNQRNMSNKYGNALPKDPVYITVGLTETWYYKNMLSLPCNMPIVYRDGTKSSYEEKGVEFHASASGSSTNGYGYTILDENFAIIDKKYGSSIYYKADNIQDATALVIGDSTVNAGTMTSKMLSEFTSRSKTLTLLGTRGTSPNNHEGRSGWSASAYCTKASQDGVTNPFYNDGFDFSYYMTQQGYSAPDFVIIQLGINDLYNASIENADSAINSAVGYLTEIIDSILEYNTDIKIILNLPTAVNDDLSTHSQWMLWVRNMFVRFNEAMMMVASTYGFAKVRCSYCHLILDPETDIADSVHPTTTGYNKMAMEVINQINCWQNA